MAVIEAVPRRAPAGMWRAVQMAPWRWPAGPAASRLVGDYATEELALRAAEKAAGTKAARKARTRFYVYDDRGRYRGDAEHGVHRIGTLEWRGARATAPDGTAEL